MGQKISLQVNGAEVTREVEPNTLLVTFLRDDQGMLFKELIDVTAVDYPEREQRFEVVYHLLSLHHNQRLRVKTRTDENTPVPSVVPGVPVVGSLVPVRVPGPLVTVVLVAVAVAADAAVVVPSSPQAKVSGRASRARWRKRGIARSYHEPARARRPDGCARGGAGARASSFVLHA